MAAPTETQNERETKQNVGRIEEIQGVVIEAVFPDELPEIYSAITQEIMEVVAGAESLV